MPKLVKLDKKATDAQKVYRKNDLWIAPANSFKRTGPQADWKLRRVEPSESNRYLELADIALGLSSTKRPRRKATA